MQEQCQGRDENRQKLRSIRQKIVANLLKSEETSAMRKRKVEISTNIYYCKAEYNLLKWHEICYTIMCGCSSTHQYKIFEERRRFHGNSQWKEGHHHR